MKRLLFAPFTALLLAVVLFTSSCQSSSDTTSKVITCLGDIGVKVVASTITEDAPLTFASLLTVVPECINAAIAAFSPPSNAKPPSPKVDINQSQDDGTSTGSVNSNTWSNCTYSYQTLQFNFFVPFEMFVGGSSSLSEYDAPPTGSSDNDLIAQQLFQQYGNFIQGITTSGPSQSIRLDVPPQSQVTLMLPIQLSYRNGEARVVRTDGNTIELPWLFTDGYQQAGRVTYTESSC